MKRVDTFLDSLDSKDSNGLPKALGPIRSTAAAVITALGLAATLSQVIPTKTHADEAKNKSAKMAQNSAGY